MSRNLFQKEKFNLCFIALVTALVMLPVLFKGIPYGNDLSHHFQCAFSYYEGIIRGDFYPSWSEYRNLGYGGMELRLYPPISHYTLAFFYFLTQNWLMATWATLTFFTVLGSFGIYFWARELMPLRQAVFAACIYAFIPYHLNQIYNTFLFAEFAGAAILPFCFAFIVRLCKRGKLFEIAGLGTSYAVLILTHLPLTVIGSICLGIYALTFFKREDFFPKILKLVSALIIGLSASAFFWIKVIQERDLLAKTAVYPDPGLDYRLNFLLTFLQTYEGFGLEVYNNTSFYDLMLLCAVVLALSCTVPFIFLTKTKIKGLAGVWIVFGVSVFLTTPFSRFLWDALPFLQEVQFPLRWLTIVGIMSAVLSASRLDQLFEWFRNNRRPFALIICGCIFAVITFSVSQIINQSMFVEKNVIPSWIEETRNSTGVTFWWSIWTRKEFADNKEKVTAESRNIEIQKWTATEKILQIAEGKPNQVRIALFYHPNWHATVNGVPAEIKSDESGAILVSIPTELSIIKVSFQETLAVQIGRWISASVWVFLFIFLALSFKKKKKSSTI